MRLIDRFSGARTTVALVISFIALSIVWFQWGPASVLSSTGIPLLDTQVEYTAQQAWEQLDAYGEIGRRQYVSFLAGDYLWVLLFGLSAISLISYALRRNRLDQAPWSWVLSVPAAVVALDWLENSALMMLTLRFPTSMDRLASGVPAVTSAKMALSNVCLVLIVAALAGIALALIYRPRPRHGRLRTQHLR